MKLSQAVRWLLGGLIIVGLTGRIVTGLTIYSRITYLGLLILGGALIWTFLSSRGILFWRNTRTLRASVGDVFEEHYEIKKDSWPGCAWLEVVNGSDLPKASGSR